MTKQPEPPRPRDRASLEAFVKSFPYWYHHIYLGQGIYTTPERRLHNLVWDWLNKHIPPEGLQGCSVLDVGTNAGFFCIQAKLRGAGRVLGLDSVDMYLQQAKGCAEIWNLDIEYRLIDCDDLEVLDLQETFDIVFFTGILYHLKNPLGVLERVSKLCKDAIVVETEILKRNAPHVVYSRWGPPERIAVTACHKGIMKFVENNELNNDGSNWWIPDEECVRGMLRTAGFRYFSEPAFFLGDVRMALIAAKQPQSTFRLESAQQQT
jgi:tRNA (mo5U34)-methyltransferase